MLNLMIRNLWAYKVRLALTSAAITLGVAFMVGTMVLTDTMTKSFDAVFEKANSSVDLIVQRPGGVEAMRATARARVPAGVVDDVKGVDGVEAAFGSISGFTQIVNADGTAERSGDVGSTVGVNWIPDERLNPYRIASGRAPEGPDEVVVDQATVEARGFQLGEKVTILAMGRPTALRLVGIANFGELKGAPGTALAAVNDISAQRLFAESDNYDSILVAARKGKNLSELTSEIDGRLGAGSYEVMSGAEDTARKQKDLQSELAFFNDFLMAFAYVSLFVGTFIIYNTFSILIAQRAKGSAMLRAIGASRRQLLWATTAESVAVGVIAGALGLGLGIAMSFGLEALVGAAGFDLPDGETVIAVQTVVTAFVVGVGITVISSVAPAIRGSRVRPIEALRDVSTNRPRASVARIVAGLTTTGAGVAAFSFGVAGGGDEAAALVGMGFVLTVLGTFVCGPLVAGPVIRMLALPLTLWGGATGEIARENATRAPKRTSATASALMIGVALVGFITILAASMKVSVDKALDKSMRADFVVDSEARQEGGFSTDLAAGLKELPQVETISAYRSTPAEVNGVPLLLDGVDTQTVDEVFDLQVLEGSIADVQAGSVAVVARKARALGLKLGDTVHVRFAGSETDLRVAAIYDAMFPEGGYLVDNATLEEHVASQYDMKVFLSIRDGVGVEAAREILEEATSSYPNAVVKDKDVFAGGITAGIDAILNLVYGLLALAVVIALMGIANTLALSVHERRREIGLLRAVGMTRTQVRSAVRWESLLIALMGTVLGMGLAIGSAWGITQAMERTVTDFVVPVIQLLVIAGLAGAAGVVAALGPARRASNLNVLDAIGAS